MLGKVAKWLKKYRNKVLAGLSFVAAGYFLYKYTEGEGEVKLSSFIEALKMGEIDEVLVEGRTVFFRSQSSDWYRTFMGSYPAQKIFAILKNTDIAYSTTEPLISNDVIFASALSLLSVGALKFMLKESNKPFMNSNQPKSSIMATDTTFDDFYGGDEIKEKFAEIIDFLKQSDKYERMGARIRRGVMFYGPPGTGKTMLARALANEAGCQFIKVVASEFQEMFAGVGAKRVRELFNVARKAEGGCIIFVDEIDALGSRLNHLRDSHETTTTINQFLSEMDGFSPSAKVVIVAATNRIDLVDSAILRSGRFDIKMHIALPNAIQRAGILKKVLNKKAPNMFDVDDEMITLIGDHSQGWCGADLETLVNESIYKAIGEQKEKLLSEHLWAAYQERIAK